MAGNRKSDHLRICLSEEVEFKRITPGWERYHFIHQALPEIDKEKIDLRINLLGKSLNAPIIISSMTGGNEVSLKINKNLAQAAQDLGLGIGLGSQRVALEDQSVDFSFQIRDVAPDILVIANLGAVQLNYGYGVEECKKIVEMIEADALALHLNPLQESIQPQGNVNFENLLPKIEKVCKSLKVPVIVKEVGCGISPQVALRLKDVGIAGIDVSGAGGTCWSIIEGHRASTTFKRDIGENFAEWGIPTAFSIKEVRKVLSSLLLIASGGIRNGIDMAKAIALGADTVGVALPLLKPASESKEAVRMKLEQFIEELKIAMFCIGAKDLAQLRKTPYLYEI